MFAGKKGGFDQLCEIIQVITSKTIVEKLGFIFPIEILHIASTQMFFLLLIFDE